jgi:hypothetical protein
MIESDPHKINIKELTLTEPILKPKIGDPKNQFIEADWVALQELCKTESVLGHGFFLMLQIADSEYRKKIELPRNIVSESAMLLGVTTRRMMAGDGDWERVILGGSDLKALNPDIYKQHELDDVIFEKLLSGFEVLLEDQEVWGSGNTPSFLALNLANLFPQHGKVIEASSKIADAVEEDHDYALNREYWNEYIHIAAAMRIAFPKGYQRYQDKVHETLEHKIDIEEYMESSTNPVRDASIQDRVINASHLRILLAEDVKLTNRGIILKMPEQKSEETFASMPVKRKF